MSLYPNINLVHTLEKEKMKTFNIFPDLEEKFPDIDFQIRINEELDTVYLINSKDGILELNYKFSTILWKSDNLILKYLQREESVLTDRFALAVSILPTCIFISL